MRTAQTQKFTHPPQSSSGKSSVTEMPLARTSASAFSVADPPLWWTTRARPTGIASVPTHAVRPAAERRAYARAKLSLPMRIKRVAGQRERTSEPLRTTNISSSGVLFLSPDRIEPGTPIAIEVFLVDRPFGRGTVKMLSEAHIVRAEPASRPGWHFLAATFDDITFEREEPLPARFQRL